MPFTDQDPIAPLENLLNQAVDEAVAIAGTNLDTLRPIRTFKWANDAARIAQTGMTQGDLGYQIDTGATYTYTGSAWSPGRVTNLQLDTANSTVRTITQVGGGKILGTGAAGIGEAVTFPVPFASVPQVIVTSQGGRAPGAFNDAGLPEGAIYGVVSGKSATGFRANLFAPGGSVPAATDWYYDWIAIGVPA